MKTEQEIAKQARVRVELERLIRANEEGLLRDVDWEWHRKEIELPPGQGIYGSGRTYTNERYYELTCTIDPRLDSAGGEPL